MLSIGIKWWCGPIVKYVFLLFPCKGKGKGSARAELLTNDTHVREKKLRRSCFFFSFFDVCLSNYTSHEIAREEFETTTTPFYVSRYS